MIPDITVGELIEAQSVTDAQQKFQTYLFFLRHFDHLVKHNRDSSSLEALHTCLISDQRSRLKSEAKRSLEADQRKKIRQLLFNCWNSELVARMNSSFDPEVRFITNQWKPIQTYYALYSLLSAIRMIDEPNQKHTHESTLRFATNSIHSKLPEPWCCRYDYDHGKPQHFPWPSLPYAQSGWNLTNLDPHTWVAHFYRTTGDHKREERWTDGKKRRHPSGHPRAGKRIQKKEITVGFVSLWDAMWRLRKWANYKEADALLQGQQEMLLAHSLEFDRLLNSILSSSAVVLECLVYARIGKDLDQSYDEYMSIIGGLAPCDFELPRRRTLICGK